MFLYSQIRINALSPLFLHRIGQGYFQSCIVFSPKMQINEQHLEMRWLRRAPPVHHPSLMLIRIRLILLCSDVSK